MQVEPEFIEGIIGPHVIGVVAAIFLFGALTNQVSHYFHRFQDPLRTKVLVGIVWLLSLLQNSFGLLSLYQRAVAGFGDFGSLYSYPKALAPCLVISGAISLIIQAFFAHRLRILSDGRFWPVTIICWILSSLRFTGLTTISATTTIITIAAVHKKKTLWLVVTTLAISTAVDVCITVSLTYNLWQRRSHIFKRSQRVIDRLIVWTLQTGLLTSSTTVLMIILFLTMDNYAWVSAFFVISGLFTNSFLSSLNARESLRNSLNEDPADVSFLFPERPHQLSPGRNSVQTGQGAWRMSSTVARAPSPAASQP